MDPQRAAPNTEQKPLIHSGSQSSLLSMRRRVSASCAPSIPMTSKPAIMPKATVTPADSRRRARPKRPPRESTPTSAAKPSAWEVEPPAVCPSSVRLRTLTRRSPAVNAGLPTPSPDAQASDSPLTRAAQPFEARSREMLVHPGGVAAGEPLQGRLRPAPAMPSFFPAGGLPVSMTSTSMAPWTRK